MQKLCKVSVRSDSRAQGTRDGSVRFPPASGSRLAPGLAALGGQESGKPSHAFCSPIMQIGVLQALQTHHKLSRRDTRVSQDPGHVLHALSCHCHSLNINTTGQNSFQASEATAHAQTRLKHCITPSISNADRLENTNYLQHKATNPVYFCIGIK